MAQDTDGEVGKAQESDQDARANHALLVTVWLRTNDHLERNVEFIGGCYRRADVRREFIKPNRRHSP